MKPVNISYRLINYAVDLFMVGLIYAFWDLVTFQYLTDLLIAPIFFFYYYYMESRTGQTFGKRITNTVVVDYQGQKPSKKALLIRSLCRLLWVDAFSFLLGPYGMHDGYSKTKVVKFISGSH